MIKEFKFLGTTPSGSLFFAKEKLRKQPNKAYFPVIIVRTLREDQPLRQLLNLLFYNFNHSEPTYKSQRIKLLDVIAACNELNVNALN